jgi:chromosome segregation ATPase
MKTITFLLLFFLQILLVGNYSVAAMYKWEDSKGGIHFTDNPDSIPAKYRKNAINRDSRENSSPTSVNIETPAQQAQSEPVQPAAKESSVVEKGREYWQPRFNAIRTELKGLKAGLEGKRERMNEYRRKWLVTQKRVERQSFNQIEDEINKDEERIKDLEKQLEALDAEAARNAVPFEWRQ